MGGLFSSDNGQRNRSNIQHSQQSQRWYLEHQRQLERQHVLYEQEQRYNAIQRSRPPPSVKDTQQAPAIQLMRFVFTIEDVPNWSSAVFNTTNIRYVTIDVSSAEFMKISRQFKTTTKKHFKIVAIQRIENPHLFVSYLLKKTELKSRHGHVNERLLFHGTKKANIDDICAHNWDWRKCGEAKGHRFGQGVSFTPISNYASHYCDKYVTVKEMIVAKVLVARSCIGNVDTVLPPNGFDTTEKENGHVVVKYADDEFYPAYRLKFTCQKIEEYR